MRGRVFVRDNGQHSFSDIPCIICV